jgi:hypothetical protein
VGPALAEETGGVVLTDVMMVEYIDAPRRTMFCEKNLNIVRTAAAVFLGNSRALAGGMALAPDEPHHPGWIT